MVFDLAPEVIVSGAGIEAKNIAAADGSQVAKELHEQGRSLQEAAIEACRMRLRPIIMTSLAFILGVLPLAISTGAGSSSQHAIGTGAPVKMRTA